MMERLQQQYQDWGDRHRQTWLGRNVPGPSVFGQGVSAQLDLMSPTAAYEFSQNPTQFNALKMMYGPSIAYGGFSWVSYVSGQQIGLAHRVVHSAHMLGHTVRATAGSAASLARVVFNPYTLMAGAFVYAMEWGHDKNPLLMLGIPSGF